MWQSAGHSHGTALHIVSKNIHLKLHEIEMFCDCVPVVTYISRTRPQETGSKVFQHQPCLFHSGQNLLLHLFLPISHFIYSFRFWHLLQMTLQSTLCKDSPMPLPAACSTQALCSLLSPLQVSSRLQGGTAGD